MDKMDHLMAGKKNENNKDSQKGQVTPKKKILNNFVKNKFIAAPLISASTQKKSIKIVYKPSSEF